MRFELEHSLDSGLRQNDENGIATRCAHLRIYTPATRCYYYPKFLTVAKATVFHRDAAP